LVRADWLPTLVPRPPRGELLGNLAPIQTSNAQPLDFCEMPTYCPSEHETVVTHHEFPRDRVNNRISLSHEKKLGAHGVGRNNQQEPFGPCLA
jgi:hypothetical protein